MEARLVSCQDIGIEVRQFVFEVPGVEALPALPGQFVSFSGEVGGRRVTRAYSLAGLPRGNRFELCLNRVREGIFSPWLFQLEPGQTVAMQGPLGYFTPRQPFRDSVLVATGTGVAPFRAFLQSEMVLGSGARITLLFGARHEESLLYRAEFEQLERLRPGFRYMPTLTRPPEHWQGRTGRVQIHLDEALEGRTDLDVYICGMREMVDDIRRMLKERGFERRQIIAEKYD
ncbi:MAG: ferredoxin--NADP reductase [Acidobacteriota bacterium]